MSVFNFDHFEYTLVVSPEQKAEGLSFDIKIKGQDTVFTFKAETKKEAKNWIREIKRHLQHSAGIIYGHSAEGLDQPWRWENISEL